MAEPPARRRLRTLSAQSPQQLGGDQRVGIGRHRASYLTDMHGCVPLRSIILRSSALVSALAGS